MRAKLDLDELAAVYGGTLYVVNPFVYDRYLAGHVHFLLALSLLPWALSSLYDAVQLPTARRAVPVAVWSCVLALVSIHALGLCGLLVLAAALVARGRLVERARFVAVSAGLAMLLCAYWLLPALFVRPGPDVGEADLLEYETRPDGFAVVPTLLAMYGFWREEFSRPAERLPALYVLVFPILALAVLGAVAVLRGPNRRFGVALAGAAVVAILLAAGTAFPPTERAFRWVVLSVPVMGAYREPQKFLAVTVLAFAVFGAAGLSTVVRRRARHGAALAALCVVLVYGHGMLWGLSGHAELAHYPASWGEADRLMARAGPGRMLVLPWSLYTRWSFSNGRIVANPAPSFFSRREVLAGDNVELPTIPTHSSDPFSYYVQDVLARGDEVRRPGRLLAPLGVRFVAWTTDAEFREFRLLSRARDLELIYQGEELSLFENRAWRGNLIALDQLSPSPPPVERAGDDFPPLARLLPTWPEVGPTRGSFVGTARRCTDGWRLDDQRARCHLGAVAAFAAPSGESLLWRPLDGARIAGSAIAAMTLIGLGLIRRWAGGAGQTAP